MVMANHLLTASESDPYILSISHWPDSHKIDDKSKLRSDDRVTSDVQCRFTLAIIWQLLQLEALTGVAILHGFGRDGRHKANK
jgi:hypothetical protein